MGRHPASFFRPQIEMPGPLKPMKMLIRNQSLKRFIKLSSVFALVVVSYCASASAQVIGAPDIEVSLQDVNLEANMELLVVSSGSMEPTLPKRALVLSVPGSSASDYLRRGAVISFDVTTSYPAGRYAQTPGMKKFTFLMRVVGLPNEKVELRGGALIVNDVAVSEAYASFSGPAAAARMSAPALIVPADSVYVLGDNRGNSNDSRFSGPVPISFIRGLVKYVSESPPESGSIDKWRQVK
jgi:signal peptidase I